MENNKTTKQRRQKKVRAKISGTKSMPRLSVHRTNKYLFAQLIDDEKAVTLLGVSEKQLEKASGTKTEKAKALGVLLAEKAKAAKITKTVFDRGTYRYHGRVKAFAEGAREGGLVF
ncbi:MAG TPA: 50S ribosomal protein L18 [Patescibacteria group bacterium]|nr:50S ribosomal protein L18 [Patescibacteria group bacterium]